MLLATWFGVGYVPVMAGTGGSLVALAMAYFAGQAGVPMWTFAVAAIAVYFPGVWAATVAERHLAKTDPSVVVVDEVLGQWLAVATIDPADWKQWVAAFLLFRLFDALKPYPIRNLERLPGGYGIMTDDAAAGLCAMIVVAGLRWLTTG